MSEDDIRSHKWGNCNSQLSEEKLIKLAEYVMSGGDRNWGEEVSRRGDLAGWGTALERKETGRREPTRKKKNGRQYTERRESGNGSQG